MEVQGDQIYGGVQIRWDTGKSLPRLHGCVIKLKAEMKNKVAF